MEARFYIDRATGLPHIHNHQVYEDEVIEVLEKADEDRPGSGGARIAPGRTTAGRCLRVIYVPDPDGLFVVTAYEPNRQTFSGISPAKGEKATMSESKLPSGWNEQKVRRVLEHYETQTEGEAVAEDEAGVGAPSETVMNVPHELVAKVCAR